MVFDIPNLTATVPAKADRSLDERVILRSFKEVRYHRSLSWIELTVTGKPTRWKNERAFRVEVSDRVFRLGRIESGDGGPGVLDRYIRAIESGIEVKQLTGRVEGWSLRPKVVGKVVTYEDVPDGSDAPPLLLLTEFQKTESKSP